jgi:hypothetical protein
MGVASPAFPPWPPTSAPTPGGDAMVDSNRAVCGAPGLFTEEYHVEQRPVIGSHP